MQLKDLSVESSGAPLALQSPASLPPSLTKLFAVESNLTEVPGAWAEGLPACCQAARCRVLLLTHVKQQALPWKAPLHTRVLQGTAVWSDSP